MTVEVPEQQIASKVQDKLHEIGRTVRIDGFRPGRAPARVVERQFGARVRNEVIGELLRSSFTEALSTNSLRPVAEPVIDPISADPGAGLAYTATFEVYPDVTLVPVETLTIDKPACGVTEADVDKMIQVLREQNKTWREVDRPAATGDQLLLDFTGTLDGQPFEIGTATDFELVLGAGSMIPGFEEGLTGVRQGDTRSLNLKFPDEFRNTDLAGKPVDFQVTIKRVSESVLPELDEAFFVKFAVTDGGAEAFRREVRENMERERDRALQKRYNTLVLERIREANVVEVPKALLRAEVARIQQESRRALIMRGLNPDQFGTDTAEIHEPQAANRVKLGLLMAEIIKQAGISAQPAKVRAMVESLAASYEQPEALVKWYYADPRRLQEIEAACLEDEAVRWIAERAQVRELSLSFDDLMNPGQTARKVAAGESQ